MTDAGVDRIVDAIGKLRLAMEFDALCFAILLVIGIRVAIWAIKEAGKK